jgi:formimidoylglutamate deiminase
MIQGHCDYALLPEGWRANVRLRSGIDGRWAEVTADADSGDSPRLGRFVIPAMPNLHSHAFQRAMAGQVERFERADDSFWSWRETMYRHAGGIDPDCLHAIARWLYTEMVEQGYSRVCEFHYVHQRPDGSRYSPPEAMSEALIAAANEVGIGLTLLPTLYQRGGFGDQPLTERQRRFHCDSDEFLRLCGDLASRMNRPGQRLGAAIHSLRAVSGVSLQHMVADDFWRNRPLHIHIAEQRKEVDDCLAQHGRRPIEHLFDLVDVDPRYCLIHATHALDHERELMARSGAVVGICTTTEANLGDGCFELADLRQRGGRWGIGSDSQAGLDPREELRWLEYQARLASGRRTVLADHQSPDVAANLWSEAVAGGGQASGAQSAGLRVGADADWLVLDDQDPALAGCTPDTIMGAWMFAPARSAPLVTGASGEALTERGHHPRRESFARDYVRVVRSLMTPTPQP